MIKFLKDFWPLVLLVIWVVGAILSYSMKKELEEAKKPVEKKPEKVHVHKFVPNGEWTVQNQRTVDVQRKESLRISDGLKSVDDTVILEVLWRRETVCHCGQTFHEHLYSTNSIPVSKTVPKDYQSIQDPKFADDPSKWVDQTR